MTLSLGPQHPSAHGVLHLVVDLQGELVLRADPDIGYLHRGTEKIAENLYYPQFVPYTDRLDYWCGMSTNVAYVLTVEKLMGIEAPERSDYIRVIVSELARITGHLTCIGAWGVDLGAMTVLLYAMRDRELVLDLFELICGARITNSYLRVGGVRYDANDRFLEKCREFCKYLPAKLDEYEKLLSGNRIWIKRNKDIGVISAEDAIDFGLGGPNLRGSGVDFDIRRDEPYLAYDQVDFKVPLGTNGDCFDRYMVRMVELREAVKIIEQCLDKIPEGAFCIDDPKVVPPDKSKLYDNMENLIHHFKYVSSGFKVPAGEAYVPTESPKGELGFYIVSDGSEKPHRLKIRAPSFVNLQSVDHMSKGGYLADVVAVISSLDPVFGECDK
ncbi:MAG: NADH dehydrogenase (quinone) subunit D [Deltaproteobacteria bacterium]|nr:NADH dehydrogenase (quinone) subunit D [Deltaproteobacteria bacterium]